MDSIVVATAGHVDHGKSSLVQALTGMDPDRWAEEKRRGLTIDLGFAHLTLDSGRVVSFVDVPGHERFIGNMLAGLGPAPVVMFVVAADSGWSAQSSDHRDAVVALGIEAVIPVITKIDAATLEQLARTREQMHTELGVEGEPIAVSAHTGAGLDQLKRELEAVEIVRDTPASSLRIWIDRAFSIPGAGTVVTGTLGEGKVQVGDDLGVVSTTHTPVKVRGLQTHNRQVERVSPVARVAVNLRGISATEVHRGDALIRPGEWHVSDVVDVGRKAGRALDELPRDVTVHVGSAALSAHVRPLSADYARFKLARAVPVRIHDRLVLRGTGERAVLGGVEVLDYDPPELVRRGSARARAEALAGYDLYSYKSFVESRGMVQRADMETFGFAIDNDELRDVFGLIDMDGWVLAPEMAARWEVRAREVLDEAARDPLSRGVPVQEFERAVGLPRGTVGYVVSAVGATVVGGFVRLPGVRSLGSAEVGLTKLVRHLGATPFAAPGVRQLQEWGLGVREIAAAADMGRVLRLGRPEEPVVVLPDAPARAMRVLAGLDQPFTLSEARQALGTTRRVAVPLLEYTDTRGWTERVDATHRRVRT